jgi:hypothetical protein
MKLLLHLSDHLLITLLALVVDVAVVACVARAFYSSRFRLFLDAALSRFAASRSR